MPRNPQNQDIIDRIAKLERQARDIRVGATKIRPDERFLPAGGGGGAAINQMFDVSAGSEAPSGAAITMLMETPTLDGTPYPGNLEVVVVFIGGAPTHVSSARVGPDGSGVSYYEAGGHWVVEVSFDSHPVVDLFKLTPVMTATSRAAFDTSGPHGGEEALFATSLVYDSSQDVWRGPTGIIPVDLFESLIEIDVAAWGLVPA